MASVGLRRGSGLDQSPALIRFGGWVGAGAKIADPNICSFYRVLHAKRHHKMFGTLEITWRKLALTNVRTSEFQPFDTDEKIFDWHFILMQ